MLSPDPDHHWRGHHRAELRQRWRRAPQGGLLGAKERRAAPEGVSADRGSLTSAQGPVAIARLDEPEESGWAIVIRSFGFAAAAPILPAVSEAALT